MFNIFNKRSLISVFSIIFIMNFVYADPTDGCELDSNTFFSSFKPSETEPVKFADGVEEQGDDH